MGLAFRSTACFLLLVFLHPAVTALLGGLSTGGGTKAGLATIFVAFAAISSLVLFGLTRRVSVLLSLAAIVVGVKIAMRDATKLEQVASIYPGGNVLVTGGSKGIGLAAVQKLLKVPEITGMIYVLSRSAPPLSHPRVRFVSCDLSNLADVKRASSLPDIRVLLLNAGSGDCTFDIVTLNVVSQALIFELHSATVQRVGLVSSRGIEFANPVLVPDLKARCNWTFGGIYDLECYGRTKAMQVLLAKAWSRAYPNITIGAVHPGAINSEIFQPLYTRSDDEFAKAIYMPKFLGGILKKVLAPLLEALLSVAWESCEVGADRVLFATLDKRMPSGGMMLTWPVDSEVPAYLLNVTTAQLFWHDVQAKIKPFL